MQERAMRQGLGLRECDFDDYQNRFHQGQGISLRQLGSPNPAEEDAGTP